MVHKKKEGKRKYTNWTGKAANTNSQQAMPTVQTSNKTKQQDPSKRQAAAQNFNKSNKPQTAAVTYKRGASLQQMQNSSTVAKNITTALNKQPNYITKKQKCYAK